MLLRRDLPDYEVKDNIGGRYIFLQAINNPKFEVWFNRNHVVVGIISTWLKDMVVCCGIEGYYTNKSCRTTAITQMSVANVPIETGMAITGHRDRGSYKRYDQSDVVAKASAMNVLATGKNYHDAFSNNVKNLSTGLDGFGGGKAAGLGAGSSNAVETSKHSAPLQDVTNMRKFFALGLLLQALKYIVAGRTLNWKYFVAGTILNWDIKSVLAK